MSYSREGRSASPPPYSRSTVRDRRSRSLSRSRRSRSRSHDSDGDCNPGNNLYVTGLSTRVTTGELEKYFQCAIGLRTCVFETVKELRTCYAKRKRGRTPTPGSLMELQYLRPWLLELSQDISEVLERLTLTPIVATKSVLSKAQNGARLGARRGGAQLCASPDARRGDLG
ncbi:hypothetical protein Acr_14g0009890 [Actinidia rufa]|uniref:RNA-binding (RRM/RBD/RNP motifs) family protein n=1 Tax=Actinidia rufa TaxID=165716 RepID=A0A7J0FS08_9ERIC|nr:hypothetical protein Acr_14g0009890 [Actinidia rufa]